MKRKMFLTSIILLLSTYFTINVIGNTTETQMKLDKTAYCGYGEQPSTGIVSFSTEASDSTRGLIKVNAEDKIYAIYTDEGTSENLSNTVFSTASVQFVEASIETSAVNDSGTGNMLQITINEPDANNPDMRDNIIAKVNSGTSGDYLTIHLQETANDSGLFRSSLYLTHEESHGQMLNMSGQDTINIVYVDNTVPQGVTLEETNSNSDTYKRTI